MKRLPMEQLLRDFEHHMSARRRLSPLTVDNNLREIRLVTAYCRRRREPTLGDLTEERLENYLASWPNARTALTKLYALRSFYKFLVQRKIVPSSGDRTLSLVAPRAPRRLPRFLTLPQARALVDAPLAGGDRSPIALRDAAVLYTLYGAGLRSSECSQLDLGDLQFDLPRPGRVTIRVRKGKGDKERLCVVGPAVGKMLRRYLAVRGELPEHDSKALFLSQAHAGHSGRVGRHGISLIVTRAARPLNLGFGAYAHLMRHTIAAHMRWAGAELSAIQAHLGHEDPRTTCIYAAVDVAYLDRACVRFQPLERGILAWLEDLIRQGVAWFQSALQDWRAWLGEVLVLPA